MDPIWCERSESPKKKKNDRKLFNVKSYNI